MADISKITLPSNNTYDIKDITARTGAEYIRGTWTAATNAWTGVTRDSALYDGKEILLFLPFAGTSTATTLNLTLADGTTTTGAKNVYFNSTTRHTTHYGQYQMVRMTYHVNHNINGTNYTGWWMDYARDTNSNVTQTATTTSANYEVLFSATADNTSRTEAARKNSNLTFNPSTGNLTTTQINGVTVGSSPKFTDTNTTYTANTTSIGSASGWTANTPTAVTKKTVVTSASGATASYADGVLTITNGSFSTGDSVTVTAGTAAKLTVTSTTVATGITAS